MNGRAVLRALAPMLAALLAAVLLAGAPARATSQPTGAPADPQRQAGQSIFEGRLPVAGRMPGHSQNLPAQAARCANCHQDRPRGSAGTAGSKPLGPLLDAAWLTQPRSRRAGPPVRYDAPSFCEVLRTGVDPAGIMIDQSMPRFDLNDGQCNALWTHLTQPGAQAPR